MANVTVNEKETAVQEEKETAVAATEITETAEPAKHYLSLEDILGKDTAELTALVEDEFETTKLGPVPFTAIDHDEYKQAKRDCVKITPDGNGGVKTDVDDDRLMVKLVILAVDKDKRSSFTFANKALLEKLGVRTAEGAVSKLLPPGEIVNFAVKIQNASGFGKKKQKEDSEAVKNS